MTMRYERFASANTWWNSSRVNHTGLRRKALCFSLRMRFLDKYSTMAPWPCLPQSAEVWQKPRLARQAGRCLMEERAGSRKTFGGNLLRQQFPAFCPNNEWRAGPFAVASSSLTGTVQISAHTVRNLAVKRGPGHGQAPVGDAHLVRHVQPRALAVVLHDPLRFFQFLDARRRWRLRRHG